MHIQELADNLSAEGEEENVSLSATNASKLNEEKYKNFWIQVLRGNAFKLNFFLYTYNNPCIYLTVLKTTL